MARAKKEKAPAKPLTPKEAAAMSDYDREMLMNSVRHAGPPTYFHKVGDRVQLGALIDCVVDEVMDGGTWYGISCKAEDRGKLYETYRWTPWVNVRPLYNPVDTVFTDKTVERLRYMNTILESLLSRHLIMGVDFEPDYQRGRVWTEKDQTLLLDSIFVGADIGKFVFRVRTTAETLEDGLNYEIIDGKQRMLTLLDFYENRFPYKGVYFNALNPVDRRTFLNCPVSVADVDGYSRENILKIFLRLNQGGRPVSDDVIHRAEELLEEEIKKNKEEK